MSNPNDNENETLRYENEDETLRYDNEDETLRYEDEGLNHNENVFRTEK